MTASQLFDLDPAEAQLDKNARSTAELSVKSVNAGECVIIDSVGETSIAIAFGDTAPEGRRCRVQILSAANLREIAQNSGSDTTLPRDAWIDARVATSAVIAVGAPFAIEIDDRRYGQGELWIGHLASVRTNASTGLAAARR